MQHGRLESEGWRTTGGTSRKIVVDAAASHTRWRTWIVFLFENTQRKTLKESSCYCTAVNSAFQSKQTIPPTFVYHIAIIGVQKMSL